MRAVVDAKEGKVKSHSTYRRRRGRESLRRLWRVSVQLKWRHETLTVVHEDGPDKYTVVENLKTGEGAPPQ